MAESKKKECVLCYDQIQYIGLGQCNHKEMCYRCHYKMRSFTVNRQCPLCNSHNMDLIITDDFNANFEDYELDTLDVFDQSEFIIILKYKKEKAGIYAVSDQIYNDLKKLIEIKCFASGCKEETQSFQSISALKKHLKEKHQRFLCDICLEHKTCILSEQKLYTQAGLEKHTKKGDFDEDGNVYFFHPYCNYCMKNFYDEEAIVRHMPDHFTCHVCGPDYKYIYYKNYSNLEKHFRMSHYLCEDKECREKSFIVFKTAPELEMHNCKVHNATNAKKHTLNQINLQTMTGFNYGNEGEMKVKGKDDTIKDKEGVDFEGQFLSLRKTKMKNTQVDSHEDEPIDYRDFYCQKYDEKYIKEEGEILQQYYDENYNQKKDERNNNRQKQNKIKRKTSGKNDELYQEDIPLLRYHQIHHLDEESYLGKLGFVLDQDKYDQMEQAQTKLQKKKITAQEFFSLFEILTNKEVVLRLFPVIAANLNSNKYEALQKEMDDVYMQQIKSLPVKHTTLINSSSTYSQFFSNFRKAIEDQLSLRIKSGKLKLNLKELKMDRSRRFQLIEILRRVKTKEMAKLKFISNFGVSVDVNSLILRKVFFADLKRVSELIETIPNHEFLHLFVYVSYCDDLLHGKDIQQDKQQISVNMLKAYFDTHPDIYRDFYPKDEEVDEQYQEEEQKQQVGIIKKSTVISKAAGSAKNQQIDTQDIYEFPSMNPSNKKVQAKPQKPNPEPTLPIDKPKNEKEIQKKQNLMSNWEKSNENPFLYESQDTKIRVNQVLKEEFPTLGGGKLQPFTVPKKKQQQLFTEEEKPKPKNVPVKPVQEKESSQWNGPGTEQTDAHDVANLKVVGVKKKGKGGQVQVSLAGYFK